jgi:hypothetical protein
LQTGVCSVVFASGKRRGCSAARRGEKSSRISIGYLMTRPTANSKHGTRYEIAVGGKPRSYRNVKAVAIDSAQDLKSRNPNIEVTVRDLENGETIVIKNPTEGGQMTEPRNAMFEVLSLSHSRRSK